MKPAFTLPSPYPRPIPGFVWQLLLNEANGDPVMAARFLYRVWRANPRNLVAWVRAAISNGWIRTAHISEDDEPRMANDWCEKVVLKYQDTEAT